VNAARFSSIVVDFGLVHVWIRTRRRRVSTRAHIPYTPTTESARNPLPARRAPTTVEGSLSLSFSLSRFSRFGSILLDVHHPGCRRVTMLPERYAPLLQRRTAEEHFANINSEKSSTTRSVSIVAVATSLTFVSLKFVQVRKLKIFKFIS